MRHTVPAVEVVEALMALTGVSIAAVTAHLWWPEKRRFDVPSD